MKPIKLGFDVDDVLADLLSEWVFRYNSMTFDTLVVADVKGWDVSQFMKRMDKIKVYDILDDPEFYLHVQVHSGALKMVQWAREQRWDDGTPMFRVMFVTSCMFPTHGDQKLQWLIDHGFFGDINPKNWKEYASVRKDYFPVSDKSVINVDILVDDNVDNCGSCMGKGILVTRAHNADRTTPSNSVRAMTLEDVPFLLSDFIAEMNRPNGCECEDCIPK